MIFPSPVSHGNADIIIPCLELPLNYTQRVNRDKCFSKQKDESETNISKVKLMLRSGCL